MDSDGFRRAREYAAWILLAAAAVQVIIGAWALSGLPGGPAANSGVIFPASAPDFSIRALVAIQYLVAVSLTALPVTAVLLAALAGRVVATVQRIALTAVIVQAVALALGLVAWLGSLGSTGRWLPVSQAVDIAVAVAGLILTNAVQRTQARRG